MSTTDATNLNGEQLAREISNQVASFFSTIQAAKEKIAAVADREIRLISDPYVDKKAVARHLGRSVGTIERYMVEHSDPLPHYRRGNQVWFRLSEVDEWMANYRLPRKK